MQSRPKQWRQAKSKCRSVDAGFAYVCYTNPRAMRSLNLGKCFKWRAGLLPNYEAINAPSTFVWGQHADGRTITVSLSTIDNAYNEISKCRKNAFLVLYGKVGRGLLIRWQRIETIGATDRKRQPIPLRAAIVLLAVGLQKPSQKSKVKDHQECLAKWLILRKEGEIDKSLREEWMIPKRLSNSRRVDPPNAARVFANLVTSGQINSALRYLSENDGGGASCL